MAEISAVARRFSSETDCVATRVRDNRPMHRLFVALRPPPAIRQLLSGWMTGVDGARWQDDDQLHLTLRYIGEVTASVGDDLAIALSRIDAPAPNVSIAGVGRFEKRGRTDTLWAAVGPEPALAALHHKVDRACMSAGLPPDPRAYRPHVTIARLSRSGHDERQVGEWIARHAAASSARFAMPHLVLYESHLGTDGAYYEAIMRWPLGTSTPANGSQA